MNDPMKEDSEKAPTPAERFRRMAAIIEHNIALGEAKFGGAAVIIPPMVSGFERPIEVLFFDQEGDPSQFLATIMTKIDIMVKELNDRKMGVYGR